MGVVVPIRYLAGLGERETAPLTIVRLKILNHRSCIYLLAAEKFVNAET
jgi:hypothetical protein